MFVKTDFGVCICVKKILPLHAFYAHSCARGANRIYEENFIHINHFDALCSCAGLSAC